MNKLQEAMIEIIWRSDIELSWEFLEAMFDAQGLNFWEEVKEKLEADVEEERALAWEECLQKASHLR